MIGELSLKKAKNFKDIKKSIITTQPVVNQNYSRNNINNDQSGLSFKKINTAREPESTFISPTKVLTINTNPIENIDLSSQKKKDLLLKYKPSSYKANEIKPPLHRNDSANSNKSDNSHKKSLYSQFSQLAQASSKQKSDKKPKGVSSNLCFNKLERANSGNNIVARNSNLVKTKATTPIKELVKQAKPVQTKHITPKPQLESKLKKQISNTILDLKQGKVSITTTTLSNNLSNPISKLTKKNTNTTVSQTPKVSTLTKSPIKTIKDTKKQLLPPSSKIVPSPQKIKQQQIQIPQRKQSVISIPDNVRVSMSMQNSLDMSPYI